MAPKSKKGRGKKVTMDINEFNEGYIPEDAYDWADDAWMTVEQKGEQILKAKIANQRQQANTHSSETRYKNDRLANGESFRTGDTQAASGIDLSPPYAAHLGNLRNGMTDEEFLSLFGESCVECHRLVNQNNKTFAFVEFKSKQALLAAIAMDHTMYKGRVLYVNLANEQQIARLHGEDPRANGNALSGLSRDKTGQQQQPGLAQLGLSRDVFGAAEQSTGPMGMPSRGPSRANLGSRVDLSDFSRDMLGTAQPDAPSSGAGSPNGVMPPKGHSLADFANWRDSDRAAQPEFATAAEPGALRDKSGDDEAALAGPDALRREDPAGPAKPAVPAGGGRHVKAAPSVPDFGTWRDEPRAEVPARPAADKKENEKEKEKEKDGGEARTGEARTGEGRGSGRGGRGGNAARGGARGGASSPKTQAAAPAADAGDRWANLRS